MYCACPQDLLPCTQINFNVPCMRSNRSKVGPIWHRSYVIESCLHWTLFHVRHALLNPEYTHTIVVVICETCRTPKETSYVNEFFVTTETNNQLHQLDIWTCTFHVRHALLSTCPNIELVYHNHCYYDPQVIQNNQLAPPTPLCLSAAADTSTILPVRSHC